MGMFDWVDASAFEFPYKVEGQFQTKDFESLMDTYIFNKNGTVTRVYDIMEMTPEEEMPYYGKPEWNTSFGKLIGCMRAKETKQEEHILPERDTFCFYGSIDDASNNWMDIYADIENHKIIQFRWEIKKYTTDGVEQIERGVIPLTNEVK